MKSFCVGVLTTGGRSEDFARELFHDDIPDHSYIQIGDFVGYSVRQCANKKIKKAIVALYWKINKDGDGRKANSC